MTDIFITSFFRRQFTDTTLRLIGERTVPGTYQIHIFDNGSDKDTRDYLYGLLESGIIKSLHLDSRNTGCLYNKGIFNAIADPEQPYYCVTDNDVYPPKLDPDWLYQMINIMDQHPEIGLLTPQLPPQSFQMPYEVMDDVVYCKAVGNTFKMIRKNCFPVEKQFHIGKYGDDGFVSSSMESKGYKVAFCRKIFCYHAGQCENWGYTQEEILKDPRKSGYTSFYTYEFKNPDTFEPLDNNKI